MSKPSPITSGREGRYELGEDEAWPVLTIKKVEHERDGVAVPEKLVKAYRKAEEELERAHSDLVRWVKYTDSTYAAAHLSASLRELGPAQRAKR